MTKQKKARAAKKTLSWLVENLRRKIEGPSLEQLESLAELGHPVRQYHRSWIGFFRIVDDIEQIEKLDRWIRAQVSLYMWRHHKVRINHKAMQDAGLPSLVNTLWRARRASQIEVVEVAAS